MTGEEYASIAAACDRLLRSPGTDLARLAIPALHFLNEHSTSLAQYDGVLAGGSGGYSDVAAGAVRAGRALVRALTASQPALRAPGPVDVVIVSHLLRQEQLHQDNDFYFGALQSHLRDQGATSLLVLISHLPDAPRDTDSPRFTNPRMVLPGVVSPRMEGRIWRQCARAWRALRQEAAAAGSAVEKGVARLASHQVLSAAPINLRMHAALAAVCAIADPKMVITTYEGTVAERLIWHAARISGRRPLCVGYQHATILERAHAIRRPVAAPGIDCDPDVVLTLGASSHALLASRPELQSVQFIEYGSHRRTMLPEMPAPQSRPRCCLVLADASHRECATLFGFALRCAGLDPQLSFILRPHPMIAGAALLGRLPMLANLPGNVSLSVDRPLEEDLARARYCLYRSSSAAVHAVRAGIRPYYVEQPGELPLDCLFGLGDWRERVRSPEQFIERTACAGSFANISAVTEAAKICDSYVAPVRPEAVKQLLALMRS